MRYDYQCRECGLTFEVRKPVEACSRDESCRACGSHPARRLYRISRPIVRPTYWNSRPGDENYSNFDREGELGEIRSPGDKPESGGATVSIPRPRVDHSSASVEAERNLRQAVEAAIVEV